MSGLVTNGQNGKSDDVNALNERVERFKSRVDELVKKYIDSNSLYTPREPVELNELARSRIYGGEGKRIRPALSLATFEAFSQDDDIKKIMPWMYFTETLHGGYLDIDDRMDKSNLRHNIPTTYRLLVDKYGEKGAELATLVGMKNSEAMTTFAIHDGQSSLWDHDTTSFILWLSYKMRNDTIDGQYMDILYRRDSGLTKQPQLIIYIGKTGSYTTGGPMAGGARIGGADRKTSEDIFDVGRNKLGIAFQIRDDLLNVEEVKAAKDKPNFKGKYGKEPGDDLTEGKPTWMVAHFNETANEAEKKRFFEKFGRQNPPLTMEERIELALMLEQYGCLEDAERESNSYLAAGLTGIKQLVLPGDKSQNFYDLIQYTVNRLW